MLALLAKSQGGEMCICNSWETYCLKFSQASKSYSKQWQVLSFTIDQERRGIKVSKDFKHHSSKNNRTIVISVDMLCRGGKFLQGPTPKQWATGSYWLLGDGELASFRDEPPNWLSKTEWLVLNHKYTNKKNGLSQALVIFVRTYTHTDIGNTYNQR